MKLFGKKTEDIVPERKNVWSIVIQVLIAALTALSGVFAGCSLASCLAMTAGGDFYVGGFGCF